MVLRYVIILVLCLVFGLGVGVSLNQIQTNKHTIILPTPESLLTPRPINCFVSDLDCAQLESVYFQDQFYGYGVKSSNGDLLSPVSGSLTTGSIRFSDELGGQFYHAVTLRSNIDPGPSLTYYLASQIDTSPTSVVSGQSVGAVPASIAMPPLGDYQVVIVAYDQNNAIIDPLDFLR